VREWIDAVRDFLTLSEASRAAVLKNLDGAFDPEQARQRAEDAFRDAGGQTLLGLR
jgi:hypothetical protein